MGTDAAREFWSADASGVLLRHLTVIEVTLRQFVFLITGLVAILAGVACSTAAGPATPQPTTDVGSVGPSVEIPPTEEVLRSLNPAGPKRVDVDPDYFERFLSRDTIRPVYEPTLFYASEVPLDANDPVIGVSIGGEARAYPIRTLRVREMVNDELGGMPILVTW